MSTRGPLRFYDCEGTLTIGSTVLNGPAWMVMGLAQLWGTTLDLRGVEVALPYGQGQVVYPRWRNALRVSLPMIINGHVAPTGLPEFHNPVAGIARNIRRLRDSGDIVPVDPNTTPVYKRTATLVLPDGTTMTGDVIPLGLKMDADAIKLGTARATLELIIPDGRLVQASTTITAAAETCALTGGGGGGGGGSGPSALVTAWSLPAASSTVTNGITGGDVDFTFAAHARAGETLTKVIVWADGTTPAEVWDYETISGGTFSGTVTTYLYLLGTHTIRIGVADTATTDTTNFTDVVQTAPRTVTFHALPSGDTVTLVGIIANIIGLNGGAVGAQVAVAPAPGRTIVALRVYDGSLTLLNTVTLPDGADPSPGPYPGPGPFLRYNVADIFSGSAPGTSGVHQLRIAVVDDLGTETFASSSSDTISPPVGGGPYAVNGLPQSLTTGGPVASGTPPRIAFYGPTTAGIPVASGAQWNALPLDPADTSIDLRWYVDGVAGPVFRTVSVTAGSIVSSGDPFPTGMASGTRSLQLTATGDVSGEGPLSEAHNVVVP